MSGALSNDRMISSGARGRGATAGNASAGLVNTDENCGILAAVDAAPCLAGEDLELPERA